MNDLTILYYSANHISDFFMSNMHAKLKVAAMDKPIISVTQKPIDLGQNVCLGNIGRSAYNIYKQVLIAAQAAKTKYVATAEDDMLYPPDHFDYRPEPGVFAYDVNRWEIFTWIDPPVFGYRSRRAMTSLTVTRDDLVRTLEERFEKYPDPNNIPIEMFGEPGRFENHLKMTPLRNERWECKTPSVVFITPEALGFDYLGTRKKLGEGRLSEIPYWGKAEEVLKLYAKP